MLGGSGVSADEVSARNKKVLIQQCLGYFRNYANWELFQLTCFSWQVSKITSHLEGCIDPFDWDVFQSHLTNNLHNLIRWVGVSFWNSKPLEFRISCRFVELLNKMCFCRRTHCLYGAVSAQSTAVQAVVAATRNPSHQVQQRDHTFLLFIIRYNHGEGGGLLKITRFVQSVLFSVTQNNAK